MSESDHDPGLDGLLDLNGQVLIVDPAGKHWVKFTVKRVARSEERPHGISYSLTLHGEDGERLVGFDNAHRVKVNPGPGGGKRSRYDHKHRLESVRPYEYTDAAGLLADFWAAVDSVLKDRGVI